jgi:putative oxidoreductase
MSSTIHVWLKRLACLGLGSVFVYAGVTKIADPLAFADSITTFQALPVMLISPVALTLPVLEVLVGLCLIAGLRRKISAVLIMTLCIIFALALTQALVRGLEVDCGCFGSGASSMAKTLWALVRDVGFGAVAWCLWRNEKQGAALLGF